MPWIKRHFYFVIFSVTALGLMSYCVVSLLTGGFAERKAAAGIEAQNRDGLTARPHESQASAIAAPQMSDSPEFTVRFRGVNLNAESPSADLGIAYATEAALKSSPYFDKNETRLAGNMDVDESSGTFGFGVRVKLKKPLKLP